MVITGVLAANFIATGVKAGGVRSGRRGQVLHSYISPCAGEGSAQTAIRAGAFDTQAIEGHYRMDRGMTIMFGPA